MWQSVKNVRRNFCDSCLDHFNLFSLKDVDRKVLGLWKLPHIAWRTTPGMLSGDQPLDAFLTKTVNASLVEGIQSPQGF